jgi:hypothetical protein
MTGALAQRDCGYSAVELGHTFKSSPGALFT